MPTHRTYECDDEGCDLVKEEPSCSDTVTFITQDEDCSCSDE